MGFQVASQPATAARRVREVFFIRSVGGLRVGLMVSSETAVCGHDRSQRGDFLLQVRPELRADDSEQRAGAADLTARAGVRDTEERVLHDIVDVTHGRKRAPQVTAERRLVRVDLGGEPAREVQRRSAGAFTLRVRHNGRRRRKTRAGSSQMGAPEARAGVTDGGQAGIGPGLRPSVLRTRRCASPLLPALRSGRRTHGQGLRPCRRGRRFSSPPSSTPLSLAGLPAEALAKAGVPTGIRTPVRHSPL